MKSWRLHYPDSFSAQAVVQSIREDRGFKEVYRAYQDDSFFFTEADIITLSDSILKQALMSVVICDANIEDFLIQCRRSLLHAATHDELDVDNRSVVEFIAALASQCYLNGYLYPCSAEEKALLQTAQIKLSTPDNSSGLLLLALCCYDRLTSYDVDKTHLDIECSDCSALNVIIEQQFLQPECEKKIRRSVKKQNYARQHTLEVQEQYESHPYPVYQSIAPYTLACHDEFVESNSPSIQNVLIAGCGTGLSALLNAKYFSHAQIDALDISLNSLARAQTMANKEHLKNLTFIQQDILDFESDKTYDFIECVGVLQHLSEPELAIQLFSNVISDKGLLRLSCYSAQGRQWAREAITVMASAQDKFIAREKIKSLPQTHPARRILEINDFYSRGEFEDMFEHVYEHAVHIQDIEEWTNKFHFRFLGFEIPDILLRQRFRQRFPESDAKENFSNWIEFEQSYPESFINQYTFWLQKQ